MKSQDTILLEKAYKKILFKESDYDMEENDVEDENMDFSKIKIGLGRSEPTPEQADILQGLSREESELLLDHLNEIGEDNEENWGLKNNLIRQLFSLVRNPNV